MILFSYQTAARLECKCKLCEKRGALPVQYWGTTCCSSQLRASGSPTVKTCDSQWGIFIYSGNAYKTQEKVINKPIQAAAESQIFKKKLQFTSIYTLLHSNVRYHHAHHIEMPHPNIAEVLKNKPGDLCSFQFFLRQFSNGIHKTKLT